MVMDIETYLGCLKCNRAWFRVERHETKPDSHVFEHKITPIDVAARPGKCAICEGELSRMSR